MAAGEDWTLDECDGGSRLQDATISASEKAGTRRRTLSTESRTRPDEREPGIPGGSQLALVIRHEREKVLAEGER
jgi:hypothetical protein